MSEKSAPLGVLVVIGVVLLLILGVANVAHAADRTVLDDETVIQTMDEEQVFASLSQELQDEISADAQQALGNEEVEPIVFDQYVSDLDTTVTVQIDGLNDAYADIVRNQLNIEALAQEAFSEEYIRSEATRNIQQFYAYLEGDTNSLNLVIDLTEPRSHFQTAISDLRNEIQQNPQVIRDSIDDQTLDRLIEEEIDRLINEELEEEIQQAAAQPGSPSEEEIEQQIREELRMEIDNRIDDELQSPAVIDAVDSALASAEGNLENEFSDQEELTEEGDEPEELDDAREALGWFGILLWALPLAAVALVGGTYAYTRSLHQTGATLGGGLAGAGILGLIIGYGLPGTVESAAESAIDAGSELESTMVDAVLALTNTLFSTIATQSLLLTVAGLGLVGVVYADSNGYFDSIKGEDGDGRQAGYGKQNGYEQHQEPQQSQYQEKPHYGGQSQENAGKTGQYAEQAGHYDEGTQQASGYQEGTQQHGQHQERGQQQATDYQHSYEQQSNTSQQPAEESHSGQVVQETIEPDAIPDETHESARETKEESPETALSEDDNSMDTDENSDQHQR